MNIAIIGTRGVPNHYGGFEQFAENLSRLLVRIGHSVTVYNSHNHPYADNEWNGVRIVHCYNPEDKIGTAGQFIYDFNCIRHARKQIYDVILQLGYTSSSVWGWMIPRRIKVTTNMDGLEWKRSKFTKPVKIFLKYAEKLAIRFSDYLIADSVGIQQYLKNTRNVNSTFIPYGAELFSNPDPSFLERYELNENGYGMLVARLEPENSIEIILDGVRKSKSRKPFIVVGNYETHYGVYLKKKFGDCANIRFLGCIYDITILNNLRYFSSIYYHGHSVGGTNPSLLEAMASDALICAHDNVFNKSVLGGDAYYFTNADEVCRHLSEEKPMHSDIIAANRKKIQYIYSWSRITDQYLAHFEKITNTSPAYRFRPGITEQSQLEAFRKMATK